MRRRAINAIAVTVAVAFAFPVFAQVTPATLGELVAIIESGDGEALAAQDRQIDYLLDSRSVLLSAEAAAVLFAGCKARSLDTANNSYGMTMLRFECPGRAPPEKCNTGDLDLMVEQRYDVNIAVAEVRMTPRENSECPYLAVPAAPPSTGKN